MGREREHSWATTVWNSTVKVTSSFGFHKIAGATSRPRHQTVATGYCVTSGSGVSRVNPPTMA
jgi:hypothetical protein